MNLQMTPAAVVVGSFCVFSAVVVSVVIFPAIQYRVQVQPSEIFVPRTEQESRGRAIYQENGCQYCHSQYVRPQDWDYGSVRVAQAGDYYEDQPPFLGSERQGPDLSLEGGLRSDGWHWAHFQSPRHTRPDSLMPPFVWMAVPDLEDLTAYVQGLGGTIADERVERQHRWRDEAFAAFQAGPAVNVEWLHAHVPDVWMNMPSQYPASDFSLARGHAIYQHFCISCHGPVGDGLGPGGVDMVARNAMLLGRADAPASGEYDFQPEAPPFNFTYLRGWDGPVGGMIYYQVMNGITGTSMPAFKTELESEKIWDVANYLAVSFLSHYAQGQAESDVYPLPDVIPASYEGAGGREFPPHSLASVTASASSTERSRRLREAAEGERP